MRGQNIAEILSKCAVTLFAHVAHSLSGSVACVDLCVDCNAPDRVCATSASALNPFAGGLGRIVPRAWVCAWIRAHCAPCVVLCAIIEL